MKDNEFRCEKCGKIYEKAWSDEESWADHDKNYPDESRETAETVCEYCYEEMEKEKII